MDEQWRPVVGFEHGYEVSNLGRVRSIARFVPSRWRPRKVEAKILSPGVDKKRGYLHVMLCDVGRRRRALVHRLVLEAFKGPCPAGHQACHFPDRNPANCCLDNLRWDTARNNRLDASLHGTAVQGETQGSAKLKDSDIPIIRSRYQRHSRINSAAKIAADYSISESTVLRIINRQQWRHVP
jgi:hypothetical protein